MHDKILKGLVLAVSAALLLSLAAPVLAATSAGNSNSTAQVTFLKGQLKFSNDPAYAGKMDLDFGSHDIPLNVETYNSVSGERKIAISDNRQDVDREDFELRAGLSKFQQATRTDFDAAIAMGKGVLDNAAPASLSLGTNNVNANSNVQLSSGGAQAAVITAGPQGQIFDRGLYEVTWQQDDIQMTLTSSSLPVIEEGKYDATITWELYIGL
ncbi:MAG: WxL domain-containing protein [Oscillospiraceae bacterium]|jgi:hypothetical protein|nr:WxL domain-containing protein [Oscillospiraceae bacterium]